MSAEGKTHALCQQSSQLHHDQGELNQRTEDISEDLYVLAEAYCVNYISCISMIAKYMVTTSK